MVLIVTLDTTYAESIARFLRTEAGVDRDSIQIINPSFLPDRLSVASHVFIDQVLGAMDGKSFCNQFGITPDQCVCIARSARQPHCKSHLSLSDRTSRLGVVRALKQNR
jgi:hypothetical protein